MTLLPGLNLPAVDYVGQYYLAPNDHDAVCVVGDDEPDMPLMGSLDPYIEPTVLKFHSPPFLEQGELKSFCITKRENVFLLTIDPIAIYPTWEAVYQALLRWRTAAEQELRTHIKQAAAMVASPSDPDDPYFSIEQTLADKRAEQQRLVQLMKSQKEVAGRIAGFNPLKHR